MEKLQSALERARQKRSSLGVGSGTTGQRETGSSRARSKMTSLDENWASLKRAELDRTAMRHNRVVALTPSAEAMPFDILRTKCILRMKQNGWKRLAITSPTPNCGKTVISCNLAAAMSRQTDMRVLLFDYDLRHPSVANTLGIQPVASVSDLLTEKTDFSEQAVLLSDNVAVSMQKNRIEDPTRVLLHQDSIAKLSQIESDFAADLTIFDMPPILASDETRGFLEHVDCALIVTRADYTKTSQIDRTEREVAEHTNVLGVALNQCKHVSHVMDYSDYGYY